MQLKPNTDQLVLKNMIHHSTDQDQLSKQSWMYTFGGKTSFCINRLILDASYYNNPRVKVTGFYKGSSGLLTTDQWRTGLWCLYMDFPHTWGFTRTWQGNWNWKCNSNQLIVSDMYYSEDKRHPWHPFKILVMFPQAILADLPSLGKTDPFEMGILESGEIWSC